MLEQSLPVPAARTYVIGDIHGCADRLEKLLRVIDQDMESLEDPYADLVFLGDYIDRGEESSVVLEFLHGVSRDYGAQVSCLMGNHEAMLLAFLDDPIGPARRWLRYGGMQTIASYGVSFSGSLEAPSSADLLDLSFDLRVAMGETLIDWLRHLPLSWNSGNLWAVHAGADPSRPMQAQEDKTLLWGHDAFLSTSRADGDWVVFGHQPFEHPLNEPGRIGIDTGAVYGGPLTALRAQPDGRIAFLQSGRPH